MGDKGSAGGADEEPEEEKLGFNSCDHGSSLLQEAGTDRLRQIPCASTSARIFAASDMGVRTCFFRFILKAKFWPPILDRSTLLQSILTKMKASAKTGLLKYVPDTTETLLLSHGMAHAEKCMADEWLYFKVHCRTCCRIAVAMRGVTKARSAL